jgi:Tol biopolymer transport system component
VRGRTRQVSLTLALVAVGGLALRGGAVGVANASGASKKTPDAVAATGSAPVVVAQVPAAALGGEALAGGTLRTVLGDGGRLVLVTPKGETRVLTAGFASAADPEVSFDGQRILFAAKKEAGDPWCIWEMRSDGSEPRKITCGAAGARQPIYQSTVYTITPTNVEPWIQLAFVGIDPGERNEEGIAPNTSLWSCKLDGSTLRRLTFNLSNDMDPVLLPDGRMLYAGWLRHSTAHGAHGRVALLGVNEDGLDYQTYAGEQGLRVKQMPTPTADGHVVFVEADAVSADGSGRLAAVSQARPLHSYRSLTSDEAGLFRAPAPLPDGRLLVAWRPDPRRAAGVAATFGIYRFDPATGARERVLQDAAWHSTQAKLIAARPTPDARSSVVREDDREGKLYAIDVNIHDLGAQLPYGAAKRLRIVEGVPSAAAPPSHRLLGEIPLAEDGSFQVQLPANTPVQLQLVDGDGLAIRSSAWLWVRNHGAQGCVGCHEDPERTPPNRFVKALQAPAPVLTQAPEKRRTVSYAGDVAPIVEAKCRSCHRSGGPAAFGGAPPLAGSAAGLAPHLIPGEARRSRLLWHLLGRNLARPWDAEAGAKAAQPVPAGTLSPDEVRAFIEWIDLGGQP